jgi:hypothetical protein
MTVALWMLAAQGIIGAFDTLYYHEWRARLPAADLYAALEVPGGAWPYMRAPRETQ